MKADLITTYARDFVNARKSKTAYPTDQWQALVKAGQERPALRALAALFRSEGMLDDAATIERHLAQYPEATDGQ